MREANVFCAKQKEFEDRGHAQEYIPSMAEGRKPQAYSLYPHHFFEL